MTKPNLGLTARFWAKVDVRGDDECWPWTAGKQTGGYGSIKGPNGTLTAHVLSLEMHTGPAPAKGMYACHGCNNPGCVNPKHLRWDYPKGNHLDAVKSGTHVSPPKNSVKPPVRRGTANNMAKLNESKVIDIRERYIAGERAQDLATEFKVSKSTIYQILYRKTWKGI